MCTICALHYGKHYLWNPLLGSPDIGERNKERAASNWSLCATHFIPLLHIFIKARIKDIMQYIHIHSIATLKWCFNEMYCGSVPLKFSSQNCLPVVNFTMSLVSSSRNCWYCFSSSSLVMNCLCIPFCNFIRENKMFRSSRKHSSV